MTDVSWETMLPGLLERAGITPATVDDIVPLPGGVSSDIIRFRAGDGHKYCAKRALGELKVEEEWKVPLERNSYEVAWLRRANVIHPGAAPRVIADSAEFGVVVLEYLSPAEYAGWKSELLEGRIDASTVEALGRVLGHLHSATFGDGNIAREFATDSLFDALRLDPYLRFTAGIHADLSEKILAVLDDTANTKLALVHGDFSPKNILICRKDGHPVILDAECAWYGDPAFDAAFCMNHFLLKSVHLPQFGDKFLAGAKSFFAAWSGCFDATQRQTLDTRVARLLPCLLLARIDGKSPVEYLTDSRRALLRKVARELISTAPTDVGSLLGDFSALVKRR